MKVTLPNLIPGSNYIIQARSKDEIGESDWGFNYAITTIVDTTLPSIPTGLTNTVVGDTFFATWNPVTTNVNGDMSAVTRYELEITGGGVTKIVPVVQQTGEAPSYSLSFEENRALLGSPRATVVFRVRAVDNKNLKSNWTAAVSATNPAPAVPTSVTAAANLNAINLTWVAPADNDLIGYNIYNSSDVKLGFVNATTYVHRTTTYSSTTLKVAAVDKFNQESTKVASNAVTPISPFTADTTAPAVPTSFAGSITNAPDGRSATAALTWAQTVPSPDDLAGFEIRYRKTGTTPYNSGGRYDKDARATSITLNEAYANHEFQIRSVDLSNNYSAWTSTLTLTAAANAAPGTVTGLTASAGRDSIAYNWTALSDADIRNYELQISTVSDFSSVLATFNNGTSTSVSANGLNPSTTYYARVRATDNGGLSSASWSSTNTASTTAFPQTPLSDGQVPPYSTTPLITAGIGHLHISWVPVPNADLVTYEVHLSTTNNFTPSYGAASTQVAEVTGTVVVIEKDTQGQDLAYGTAYYVKLVAKDRDGRAAPSAQASGSPRKVGATDSALTPIDVGAVPRISADGVGLMKRFMNVTNYKSMVTADNRNIVITSPITFSAYMTSVRITGYNYRTQGVLDSTVTFYAYSNSGNGLFANPTVVHRGAVTPRVRVAKNANNTVSILLTPINQGQSNTQAWQYPEVNVSEVTISQNSPPDSFLTGWTTSLVDEVDVTAAAYPLIVTPSVTDAVTASFVAQQTADSKTGASLINNPSRTKTVSSGMTASGGGTLAVEDVDFNGITIPSLKSTSEASTQNYFEYFDLNPTQAYEIRFWVKDANVSAAGGAQFYVGLVGDSGGGSLGFTGGNRHNGTAVASNTNFYFVNNAQAQTNWQEHVYYILPQGTPASEALGLGTGPYTGSGNIVHAISNPAMTRARLRILNWGNTTGNPRSIYIVHPTITPVSMDAIRVSRQRIADYDSITVQPKLVEFQSKINLTVKNYTTEYAVNSSETTAPTTGWSTTQPARTAGTFVWWRLVTTYTNDTTSTSNPALLTGNTGAQGNTGNGITGTEVRYQTSSSGTAVPTGFTSTTPTATTPGQFLWTRTTLTYSDNSTSVAYAVAAHGASGNNGTNGRGIANTTIDYAASASNTSIPTSWSTTIPSVPSGQYLWTRTTITYTDSSTPSVGYSISSNGTNGANAPVASLTATTQLLTAPAAGGATTPSTSTITPTVANTTLTQFDYNVDGAGWNTTEPAGVSRNTSTNIVTITGANLAAGVRGIAVRMRDANGVGDTITVARVYDGATGGAGNNGNDAYTVILSNEAHVFPAGTSAATAGNTTSQVFAYKGATRVAATVGTITGMPTGMTITSPVANNGTTTATFQVNVTTSLTTQSGVLSVPVTVDGITFTKTFAWSLSRTGATGNTGTSIVSVTPFFQLLDTGSAAPATPSGATPASPWTSTEPGYTAGKELWRTERITFANPTSYSYTTPQKVSAYAAAVTAIDSANGKNKIFHSDVAPGTTANTIGDTWIQVDNFTDNRILAQFRGTGGTGWVQERIRSEFIAFLDAEKISANSTFTNNLNVRSTFTLGASGTPGIIQSYDYVAGSAGFKLGSDLLDIRQGTVAANTLVSGTGIVNSLIIQTGGTIQSSDYAGGSAGFRLGPTGLDIREGGATISASTVRAGNLGGPSGTTSVINITTGTSLVLNGGEVRSNPYTAGSAGWRLGPTGLELNDANSSVKVEAIKSGTYTGQTFIVGAGGSIQTSGYTGNVGSGGFRLTSSALEIPDGTLTISKINAQMGPNLIPAAYSDFELSGPEGMFSFSTQSPVAITAGGRYGQVSLEVKNPATVTASPFVYLAPTQTTYNIPVDAGQTYIVSAYVWNPTSVATNVAMNVKWSTGAAVTGQALTAVATGGTPATATRFTAALTAPANATGAIVYFTSNTLTSGAGFDVDGVQFERRNTSASNAPSPWTPGGTTSIAGNQIRTGQLISTETATVIENGVSVSVPLWNIPLSGSATFSGLRVLGDTVLGKSATDTSSILSSANYVQGDSGWQLRADGTIDLLNVQGQFIRGNSITTNSIAPSKISGDDPLGAVITLEGAMEARGSLGEVVRFGFDGFKVTGPHEIGIASVSISSNVATVTTNDPHGFETGSDVHIAGLGSILDGARGPITVSGNTPETTTTFTFAITAANQSFGSGGLVYGASVNSTMTKPTFVDFPSTIGKPNIISGYTQATNLSVASAATFRNSVSLDIGSTMTIASKVFAPSAGPLAENDYDRVTMARSQYVEWHSGASNGNFVSMRYSGRPSGTNGFFEFNEVNPSNGNVIAGTNRQVDIPSISYYAEIYNYFRNPNNIDYVLYGADGNFTVAVISGTTLLARHNVRVYNSSRTIAIGWNYANSRLIFADKHIDNNTISFTEYPMNANGTINTGEATTVNTTTNASYGYITSVIRGTFDTGVDNYIVKLQQSSTINNNKFLNFTPAGARNADYDWSVADNSEGGIQLWWNSTLGVFVQMSLNTRTASYYNKGAAYWVGPLTKKMWLAHSYYDSVSPTQETNLSPATELSWKKRARVSVTIAPIPGNGGNDVAQWSRVYTAVQDAMPPITGTTTQLSVWNFRAKDGTTEGTIRTPATSAIISPTAPSRTEKPVPVNTFGNDAQSAVITSTSGNSYWKGDDTAQFFQLSVVSSTDVNALSGNKPPLRVGPANGQHLRIDGNEILAMGSDTSNDFAVLNLNLGSTGEVRTGGKLVALSSAEVRSSLLVLGPTETRGDMDVNHPNGGLIVTATSNTPGKVRTRFDSGGAVSFIGPNVGITSATFNGSSFGSGNTTNFYCNTIFRVAESTLSDRRDKRNIVSIDKNSALGLIKKVNIAEFQFNSDDTGLLYRGVIAQELKEIMPTAVRTYNSNRLGVNYDSLNATHIAATQALAAEHEALQQAFAASETAVVDLTDRNDALEAQVTTLEQQVATLMAWMESQQTPAEEPTQEVPETP